MSFIKVTDTLDKPAIINTDYIQCLDYSETYNLVLITLRDGRKIHAKPDTIDKFMKLNLEVHNAS